MADSIVGYGNAEDDDILWMVGCCSVFRALLSMYIFLGLLVWAVALPVIKFVIKGSPAELGVAPDGDKRKISIIKAENSVSKNDIRDFSGRKTNAPCQAVSVKL